MCIAPKMPSPPPMSEPKPETPPQVSNATTENTAPKKAKSTSEIASTTAVRKRRGRGSLRIPLTSSGLSGSGLNFPTS